MSTATTTPQAAPDEELSPEQRYLIRRLRAAHGPHREPLGWLSAEHIASTQATLLLAFARRAGKDPVGFLASLPILRIEQNPEQPVPSAHYWDKETKSYVLTLRSGDSLAARRFGVLHEFKRLLDRGNETRLYDNHVPEGMVQATMAADHFAASALLPRRAVRAAAAQPGASVKGIAAHFHAPLNITRIRLAGLGLLESLTPTEPPREEGSL